MQGAPRHGSPGRQQQAELIVSVPTLPSYLNNLNPQQREAVEAVDGPVLILAGAGSGKTRVITYRIAHLIDGVGVQPDSILAVTFTNKAAGEMASRVESLVGARSLAKPLISTFHSFCVRVLRRDIEALQIGGKGYRKDFVIYDEADQQNVVKAAMRRLGIDDKQLTPRSVLSRISWAKNHMLDPQEVYLAVGAIPRPSAWPTSTRSTGRSWRKSNALDFDDLLLFTRAPAEGVGRDARALQPPLSLPPGGRVSGHQPPAVRTDAHAGRQRAQRLRRGRRGPEHLLLARRRHPQHSGVRAGLPRGAHHPPGAELPLDAEHSAGSLGGGLQQRQAQGQEPVDRAAAAAPRSATTKRRMARTKRCSPPTTSPSTCARRMAKMARRRAQRCCIAPTRSRGCSKRPCAATR